MLLESVPTEISNPIPTTYSFRAFKPFYGDLRQRKQTKADQCRARQTKNFQNFHKFPNFPNFPLFFREEPAASRQTINYSRPTQTIADYSRPRQTMADHSDIRGATSISEAFIITLITYFTTFISSSFLLLHLSI